MWWSLRWLPVTKRCQSKRIYHMSPIRRHSGKGRSKERVEIAVTVGSAGWVGRAQKMVQAVKPGCMIQSWIHVNLHLIKSMKCRRPKAQPNVYLECQFSHGPYSAITDYEWCHPLGLARSWNSLVHSGNNLSRQILSMTDLQNCKLNQPIF